MNWGLASRYSTHQADLKTQENTNKLVLISSW